MRAWTALVMACLVGVVGLGAYAGWNLRDLPEPGKQAAIIRNVDVFDRAGQLIAQRSPNGEFHIYTPWNSSAPTAPRPPWRPRTAASTSTPPWTRRPCFAPRPPTS